MEEEGVDFGGVDGVGRGKFWCTLSPVVVDVSFKSRCVDVSSKSKCLFVRSRSSSPDGPKRAGGVEGGVWNVVSGLGDAVERSGSGVEKDG